MKMKRSLAALLCLLMLTACGAENDNSSSSKADTAAAQASAAETSSEDTSSAEETEETPSEAESADDTSSEEKTLAPQQEVGFEGMEAITADKLADGVYHITVDSSSSMFTITDCELTVADGAMTAKLFMKGTGYEWLYLGTEEEAEASAEADRIAYAEEADGTNTFTVPVEALDKEIDCAAYSKRKELWYARTLVFRADSLPTDAYAEGAGGMVKVADAGIEAGTYDIEVTLEGGSGKASVQSPCRIEVKEDGTAEAYIIWSSDKYDYMVVDGEKYEAISTEGGSTFKIPVLGFNYKMPVKADTTAMSTPHEIDYTLYFDLG